MTKLRIASELVGRILLMSLFLISGLEKIAAYASTAAYMASAGVPVALLPVVIVTEVFGSFAVILGWKTRPMAFLLAGYTLATAFLFHVNFANQIEMAMFLKNLSITGAFLLLAVNGPGPLSLDARNASGRGGSGESPNGIRRPSS
jgi:putative oxidoreductase